MANLFGRILSNGNNPQQCHLCGRTTSHYRVERHKLGDIVICPRCWHEKVLPKKTKKNQKVMNDG
jgi:hypothetical protein